MKKEPAGFCPVCEGELYKSDTTCLECGKRAADLLKRFMQEHFPYSEFKKSGIFTKEMRNDYPAQAQRICDQLNLKSIYEYGIKEIRCHISYAQDARPAFVNEHGERVVEPFVTVIKSIYDE